MTKINLQFVVSVFVRDITMADESDLEVLRHNGQRSEHENCNGAMAAKTHESPDNMNNRKNSSHVDCVGDEKPLSTEICTHYCQDSHYYDSTASANENQNDQLQNRRCGSDCEGSCDSVKSGTFTPLQITDLPPEIIHHILSYLDQCDLCFGVALVSRGWRDIAYDPMHWQVLSFSAASHLDPDTLWQVVQRAGPTLKSLSLRCCDGSLDHDVFLSIAKNCPHLKCLDLSFLTDMNSTLLSPIVNHCSNLVDLNVEGGQWVDHRCAQMLCRLKSLQKLNLSHCINLIDESITVLARNLSFLEDINIDGITMITDW